jgi:hypothetical protein
VTFWANQHKYEDDKIVQNPEAIYAQILQVQEKDIVQEITEGLSKGLKEVFEKNGLTINEKGVYKIRVPETTWKQIVIDFIEPLQESKDPITGEKCNAMLVVPT